MMPEKPYFISEELEPMAAMIVGRFFARVEWEKEHGNNDWALEDECQHFWYAMEALNMLSITTNYGEKRATHFSLAVGNEMQRVAGYIESVIGVNPIKAKWGWK